MMNLAQNSFNFRVYNLKKVCFEQMLFEELSVLGELLLVLLHSNSDYPSNLTLHKKFNPKAVAFVLTNLGLETSEFEIRVFPNGETTYIKILK